MLVNSLWFCSLIISLVCALLATLVQQWSRDYVRDLKEKETLNEDLASRALNHVYIRMGLSRYGMNGVVNLIVTLVHLAVIVFAAGLLLFLFPINLAVYRCTLAVLCVFGAVYFIAGILPIFDASCPFRTPLTYPLNIAYLPIDYLYNMNVWSYFSVACRHKLSQWFGATHSNLTHPGGHQGESFWGLRGNKSIVLNKRRAPRNIAQSMSASHFTFVWEHMWPQMMVLEHPKTGDNSWMTMLFSIVDILHSTRDSDVSRRCSTLR